MNHEDYGRRVGALLKRLQDRHHAFVLELCLSDVVILIAQMQLALRHPMNVGPSAERGRKLLEAWIDKLDAAEPGIGELLRLGFNPEHDTRVG